MGVVGEERVEVAVAKKEVVGDGVVDEASAVVVELGLVVEEVRGAWRGE